MDSLFYLNFHILQHKTGKKMSTDTQNNTMEELSSKLDIITESIRVLTNLVKKLDLTNLLKKLDDSHISLNSTYYGDPESHQDESITNSIASQQCTQIMTQINTVEEKLIEVETNAAQAPHTKPGDENIPASPTTNLRDPKQTKEMDYYTKTNAEKIKYAMIQDWNNSLRYRKLHYWQYIRNGRTAKIFHSFRTAENIIIPSKFQMKPFREEPEAQTRIREKQVLNKFETEIELMELRSESHLTKTQNIDEEMKIKLSRKSSGKVLQTLQQMWVQETQKQEEISNRIWNRKNKPFWENYGRNFTIKYESLNPFIKEQSPHQSTNRNLNSEDYRPYFRSENYTQQNVRSPTFNHGSKNYTQQNERLDTFNHGLYAPTYNRGNNEFKHRRPINKKTFTPYTTQNHYRPPTYGEKNEFIPEGQNHFLNQRRPPRFRR